MAELLFSYSHKDEDLRDELEIHLSALKRQKIISTWHDRRIDAGEEFDEEINENLERADIILLLVSHYFIASDYCYNTEMKRALERHHSGDAIVIPVILSPCDWHDLPFGKLLASSKEGKPITKFPDKNDGFLEVTKAVKVAAKKIHSKQKQTEIINNSDDIVVPKIKSNIRSSNLRIKKQFTDHDRDIFLSDAFEYMANFFEGSLKEIEKRNQDINTNFKRINAYRFSAVIYHQGSEVNRCNIWTGDEGTFAHGILYSSGSFQNNGWNESLTVENDGYQIYLKPLGFQYHRNNKEEKMSFEGASEYYWSIFIERLQ
jgi:hypothetical protein